MECSAFRNLARKLKKFLPSFSPSFASHHKHPNVSQLFSKHDRITQAAHCPLSAHWQPGNSSDSRFGKRNFSRRGAPALGPNAPCYL